MSVSVNIHEQKVKKILYLCAKISFETQNFCIESKLEVTAC